MTTGTPLRGLSHLGLTVTDLTAAETFWTEVMGFEKAVEQPGIAMFVHREARVALGISTSAGEATGSFDHRRPGLDHLAFAVADLATLSGWCDRLDEHGIAHSGIVHTDAGDHLNFCASDDLPIELFVLGTAFALAIGLGSADDGVAGSHLSA